MPSQITNYQCPACYGPLHFVGASGKLECDYCGSTYDVAEIEKLYAEKEAKAKEAFADAEKERAQEQAEVQAQDQSEDRPPEEAAAGADEWDHSSLNRDWGEEGANMRSYSCPSCGAELICDSTTAATSCPYCGNTTVVPGHFDGALKPDYVLPFRLNQDQARAKLKEHYKGKRFLPSSFRSENRINEIKGIYVPFWMFDSRADADVSFAATRTETHREGDYRVTNTRHYHARRIGTVDFQKIPVDASSKMPDDYMDAIEPFSYDDLKPFSTAYLPGFLADRYDVDTKDCATRAEDRMINSAIAQMQADVQGYDSVTPTQKQVALGNKKVHYAMLPVYMLNTRWKGKEYLFSMNGQTGKMVSKLPVDWGKFWLWFAGITAAGTLTLGTILFLAF